MQPVRLTAAAAKNFPRLGLFALVLGYILIGMVGRDPWKNDDALAFGAMATMLAGDSNDWLLPNIADDSIFIGPLGLWPGAFSMELFSPFLGDVLAGRLPTVLALLVTAFSLWRWVYRLSIGSSAQPYALPFGGQPTADNYARMCADCSLLLFIGSLGLLLPAHAAGPAAILLMCLSLYFLVSTYKGQRFLMAALEGVLLGAVMLTWNVPLALLLMVVRVVLLRSQSRLGWMAGVSLLLSLLLAFAILLLWLVPALRVSHQYVAMWWHYQSAVVVFPTWTKVGWLIQNSAWFFFPSLPFALWGLWRWRKQWGQPHLYQPLLFGFGLMLFAVFASGEEETYLLLWLPTLSVLAAFGLPTMKRGGVNGIDWFSLVIFTMVAALIWLVWLALQFGFPTALAEHLYQLWPIEALPFRWFPFLLALLASVGWGALAYWRIAYKPIVLWRAVVLSVVGVLLCWLLLMTLWLDVFNAVKSYRPLAREISAQLPYNSCTYGRSLPVTTRALLVFFAGVNFQPIGGNCRFLLVQRGYADVVPEIEYDQKNWKLAWSGHKPGDRERYFLLYVRNEG